MSQRGCGRFGDAYLLADNREVKIPTLAASDFAQRTPLRTRLGWGTR